MPREDQPAASDATLPTGPSTVYVFCVDNSGNPAFTFVSAECAAIYGFSAEQAVADVRLMHDAIHPEDRDRFHQAGTKSMDNLEPMHWQGRIIRPDGSLREVAITSQPRRSPDGGTEWHGAVVDRTDLRVEMSALHEQNLRFAEKDRTRSDLLTMLSHDLAQPLSAILGYAEQCLDVLDGTTSADELTDSDVLLIRRSLQALTHSTYRLDQLQRDLLTMATTEAGRLVAQPQPVQLRDHMMNAALSVSRGPRPTVDCPAELTCFVQPSHLDQILANLVSNAAKYARGHIELVARRDGADIVIDVADDGPGIPATDVDRVFDRYHRAQTELTLNPATRAAPNAGLGLYIVRELVTVNDGHVGYRTSPHGGAMFTVRLPAPPVHSHKAQS